MTEHSDDAVAPDQLRISVEMGSDYSPSAELADALEQLRSALEGDDEVGGFAMNLKMGDTSIKLGGTDILSRSSFTFDTHQVQVAYTENDSKGKKNY